MHVVLWHDLTVAHHVSSSLDLPQLTLSFEPRPPLRLSRKQGELSGIILLPFQSENLTFVSVHCGKANYNALPSVKTAGFRELPRAADDKFLLRASF